MHFITLTFRSARQISFQPTNQRRRQVGLGFGPAARQPRQMREDMFQIMLLNRRSWQD